MKLGDIYVAGPEAAHYLSNQNKCNGKQFRLMEIRVDCEAGVAKCEDCGFKVGVIDNGITPTFDDILDDSQDRPFVVSLRFVNGARELAKVRFDFSSMQDTEAFVNHIRAESRAELSRNRATGFEMSIHKEDRQIGATEVFVI